MGKVKLWWLGKMVKRTGRTIDMRNPGWGHSINLTGTIGDNKGAQLTIWTPSRPRVGDEIVWFTKAGQEVTAVVVTVEPAYGVWDMSWLNVYVTNWQEKK